MPDTLVDANVLVLCILLYVFWLLLNKYIIYTHVPIAGEQAVLAQAEDDRALALGNTRDQWLSDDSRLVPNAPSCDVVEEPSREPDINMRESPGQDGVLRHLVHEGPTQIDPIGLPKPAKVQRREK